jgi:hypothetical protein
LHLGILFCGVLGRARSLMAVTILGFLGITGFIGLALWLGSLWLGAIAVFMLLNCWGGLRHAQDLLRLARLPRREGFACASCRTAPPLGPYWQCGQRRQPFDTFQTRGVCQHCAAQFATTRCLDCGEQHPMNDWIVSAYAGSDVVIGSSSAR